MDTIKAGTRVVIDTDNGGRICGTLTSDYIATFPAFIKHDEHGHAVTLPGYRIRSVRPQCCIQWIDGNGNATPDTCAAVGIVYQKAHTWHGFGGSHWVKQSARFPICANHRRRLDDAGMENWVFEPYAEEQPAPPPRGGSYDSVFNALCTRIRNVRLDLVAMYGITAVMAAAEDYASGFESDELDEIGTSDVSCWIADIEQSLRRQASARFAFPYWLSVSVCKDDQNAMSYTARVDNRQEACSFYVGAMRLIRAAGGNMLSAAITAQGKAP